MFLVLPLRWSGPSTWSWIVWAWLAIFLLSSIKPLWQWLARQRAESWPLVAGRIESVEVAEPKKFLGLTTRNSPTFFAQMNYIYLVDGISHTGVKQREFGDQEEAWEYLRDLEGKPVEIQYKPGKPGTSSLSESSLQALLQARPPVVVTSVDPRLLIPSWAIPFLWFFAVLSLIGLVLSLYVHVSAMLGAQMPQIFWLLHVGIFVVWFPAVFVGQRRSGKKAGGDFWKVVSAGAPAWMRYVFYMFFYYAIGNFFLFMANAPAKDAGSSEPPSVWRGFSGHWMAFYSAAFLILYSAAVQGAGPHCVNGHLILPGEPYCSKCGHSTPPPQ